MLEYIKKLVDKNKWVMYCVSLMIGLAMGIINPLATTHMARNNAGDILVGIISSTYFLFMAIGSVYVYKKQRGRDLRMLMIFALAMAAVSSVIFPLFTNFILWFLLMSLMGTGISLNMVGIQTAMHKVTDSENKALVSGIYSFCFAFGFVLSAVIGPAVYENISWMAFLMGSLGLCIAAFLVYFRLKNLLVIPENDGEKTEEREVFSKITLALLGAFAYGFSETTLVSLYPLFMSRLNYSSVQSGYALGIFIVGSIIGTIPVSYLADRIGRKKCLTLVISVSLIPIVGIMVFDNFIAKMIFSFVAGFTVGPIYPLSLALSVQDLTGKELISGTAFFTFAYGIGSTTGPFLSSVAMRYLGNKYIFSITLLFFVSMLLYMIGESIRLRKKAKNEDLEQYDESLSNGGLIE
ncbi:MFS transporter [Acetivibrio straminisolvens]|uniref:Major facilitator superfamily MFS_1 n=1 Tax=Acetivibrio straminisolvens JCM 21531 TaxID=1294263 RepID=W4V347_9FIRM|nr:MFS transporter [Acetivibrio straminisolvens]GAE87149.1 major facilitator superfamily MFS_1 [Acetivibrio straminisolvens JCM 21531]